MTRKVATIEINRPNSLHAMDGEVLKALGDEVERAVRDPKIRAIVVGSTGGRAFSAGLDTKWLTSGEGVMEEVLKLGTRLSSTIHHATKPVVCRVNGLAVGWGFIMAMCCDFRVVAGDANVFFQLPEFDVNIFPATGASYFAILNFGLNKAREMIFTRRRYSVQDLQNLGWITEVVPLAELEERTFKFALMLSKIPPALATTTKAAMALQADRFTNEMLQLEKDCVHFLAKSPKVSELRGFVEELRQKYSSNRARKS